MKKYKAGIVGLGRIASLFANDPKRKGISTHTQAYLADKRITLSAVCDKDEARLREFGAKWGVKNLYTEFDEMLTKESLDLLSVCTWNSSHAVLCEKALKKGVKGIICEKPVADSLANADKMIAASKKYKAPILVNYSRSYVKLYHQIAQMIQSGKVGDIQSVSCYYTAGLLNTGTHLFDFLRLFFGPVEWVWADPVKSYGEEDKTHNAYIYFKKGFGCTLTALDVSSYLMFEADIYGTKQRIRLEQSGTEARFWQAHPHPLFSGYNALKQSETRPGDLSEALPRMVDNLIGCIEKKQKPLCSASDARESLEIAAAIRISAAKGGGQRVHLPVKDKQMKMSSR